MRKRGKLEIIKDILLIIRDSKNSIKITPLIRQSNMSSSRFKEYYNELISKGLIKEINQKNGKRISLSEKGFRFLDKYEVMINFIEEFDL